MGEHITTRAYATIASLLLYGAKRGMCAVAMRVPSATPQPQIQQLKPQQPQQPQQPPFNKSGEPGVSRPVVTPRPAAPKSEEPIIETGTLGAVEPELNPETEGEIEIEVGTEKTKKGRLDKFMNRITELFTGKDDEYTF